MARVFRRLADFVRIIIFDKRGTGLSDRAEVVPTLEDQMDDVAAVMDAAGSERSALFGVMDGGTLALLFAASHPARTEAVITYAAYACFASGDFPWGIRPEALERLRDAIDAGFQFETLVELFAPSRVEDEAFRRWFGRYARMGSGPGGMAAVLDMASRIDIRPVLGSVQAPTLVLHRDGDRVFDPGNGRYLAGHMPRAAYVELSGQDTLFWAGDADAIVDEIQEFLTGVRPGPVSDRVLATVLFVDVVASTERAAGLGDIRWRETLDRYYNLVRAAIERHRGRLVKTIGDGVLGTFDGPARAIRAAQAIVSDVGALGLEARAGIHSGEVEVLGDDIAGVAVHIGERVCAQAAAGEVLVSRTVVDLVAGSGLDFDTGREPELKGLSGSWRLHVAVPLRSGRG